MKTELLATLSTLSDQINALPNDPALLAPIPTGLGVTNSYVMGSGVTGVYPDNRVIAVGIGWDDTAPNPPSLYVKGADTNPAGPQDWTLLDIYSASPGEHGERYTHVLQNPAGQVILFRLIAVNADGIASAPAELTVNADDYLQS